MFLLEVLSLSLWLSTKTDTFSHTHTHTQPQTHPQPAYKYYTHMFLVQNFHSKLIDKKCFCLYILLIGVSCFDSSQGSKAFCLIVRFLAFTHSLCIYQTLSLFLSLFLALLLWTSLTTNQRYWPAPIEGCMFYLYKLFVIFIVLIWTT